MLAQIDSHGTMQGMSSLSCHTAGESHGPALTCLINGLPAGVLLDIEFINAELGRRQGGYGRGARQRIESDRATFLAGVRVLDETTLRTTGAPVVIQIPNKDSRLDDARRTPPVHRPRPGHADLAGSLKWLTTDCRDTLERASARETAARTAAGAAARCLLRQFDIHAFGFVRSVLDVQTRVEPQPDNFEALRGIRDNSEVACPDAEATAEMITRIRQAKEEKDTLGGLVETHVFNCPPGLGSCANWFEKLDARLAFAVMSIQAFKAVEIGLGKEAASRPGSHVHDPIRFDKSRVNTPSLGFTRPTNNAGGLEGGMTNGMPIVVRAAMKPISTLLRGMPSVNLNTRKPEHSDYERSDVCAIAAASVVMENVVAFEVASAFLQKFCGDTLLEVRAAYDSFLATARKLPLDKSLASIAAEPDQTEA
jgi:chorismate synthase